MRQMLHTPTSWIVGLGPVLLVLLLAACGGDSQSAQGPGSIDCTAITPGNAEAGQVLFARTLEETGGAAPRCSSCHAVDNNAQANVGPGLQGIAAIAPNRVEGQSAEEYLCRSIVAPSDHIVAGYPDDIVLMPVTYGATLNEQQISDLIAYMQTLE